MSNAAFVPSPWAEKTGSYAPHSKNAKHYSSGFGTLGSLPSPTETSPLTEGFVRDLHRKSFLTNHFSPELAWHKQTAYAQFIIKTFSDSETECFFQTGCTRRIGANIRQRAAMRLLQLHNATSLEDLKVPPSNRPEKLSGDRDGQWSIRINQQWRVCFRFENGDAYDVEIVDYH